MFGGHGGRYVKKDSPAEIYNGIKYKMRNFSLYLKTSVSAQRDG